MKRIMWQAGIFLFCCLLFSGCGSPKQSGVSSLINEGLSENIGIRDFCVWLSDFQDKACMTGRAFMESANNLYQEYVPGMEEALKDCREGRGFTVDYAAYDRYFYYDVFYLPEGLITILSEDSVLKGFSMKIRCRGRDYDAYHQFCAGPDSSAYLCEYYEMDGFRYFSYTDTEGSGMALFPAFMCMEEMEILGEVNPDESYYTVYREETGDSDEGFFRDFKVAVPAREYLEADGVLYRIDRQKEALFAVDRPGALLSSGTPAKTEFVYESWLLNQKELCQNLLFETAVSEEEVNAILPKGYVLSFHDYTVADMNGDGILDVLALIRPKLEQYEDRCSFPDDSPYGHVPEYYYTELWMFSGQPDGGYKGERIMDSVSVVDDDVLTLVDITGFDGGFYMEYFVGRSPFKTKLKKYVYKDGSFHLARQYENNDTGFYKYDFDSLPAQTLYPVSVEQYVNDTYGYLLCESEYKDYGRLFSVPDEELAFRITESLKGEIDSLFAAMEKLDECHDVLLQNSIIYANSRIVVLTLNFYDYTADDVWVARSIPITIDLHTGEIIDYRDYISSEDLTGLLACESPECPSRENIAGGLFDKYDDYESLLKAESPSMTVMATHEGLCLMNTEEHWPSRCLIPKSRLIDSLLSVLWDDWP